MTAGGLGYRALGLQLFNPQPTTLRKPIEELPISPYSFYFKKMVHQRGFSFLNALTLRSGGFDLHPEFTGPSGIF